MKMVYYTYIHAYLHLLDEVSCNVCEIVEAYDALLGAGAKEALEDRDEESRRGPSTGTLCQVLHKYSISR